MHCQVIWVRVNHARNFLPLTSGSAQLIIVNEIQRLNMYRTSFQCYVNTLCVRISARDPMEALFRNTILGI